MNRGPQSKNKGSQKMNKGSQIMNRGSKIMNNPILRPSAPQVYAFVSILLALLNFFQFISTINCLFFTLMIFLEYVLIFFSIS
ncbi:hypothetical protein M153_5460003635 [Pseudoloma neurophilia]|uniref:Transmembrane protein n=1 Tax=Pseudoloma neurophilia TaxID=146866 RepID=A0A0R0LX73_9MICR|nr:hypothetical protein M153_5460003635 [Pseudoloma neurophilia]